MNIVLGITGGIAAYKSAELVRLLKTDGFNVRVVMSASAQKFVTPLTFQALSGYTVHTDLFESESELSMDHIQLARWADLILVAPASANFIARLAQGCADDLLSTLCLATTAPIAIAPAMNQQMWLNPATQSNVNILKQREVLCYGPSEGEQVCGEFGPGRMLEPSEILNLIVLKFQIPVLLGKTILVTAGPTYESIDPIRYLTNRSTGTMGYALAESAAYAGARVVLISGPTNLTLSNRIEKISVNSALEMETAVMSQIQTCDIFIAAAAVSDYRPEVASLNKIKKSDGPLILKLVRNPDILSKVTQQGHSPFTVGFAAETDELLKNAKSKLQEKNLDMIIANQVGYDCGFGDRKTSVTILTRDGKTLLASSPPQSKSMLSKLLIQTITENFLISRAKEISNFY